MSRKKEPLGSKIFNKPELEGQIVYWITQDPKISDYTIMKNLKEMGIKISTPTITSWRKNFYSKSKTKIQETKKDFISENNELDIKFTQLKDLSKHLVEVKKRKDVLFNILESKVRTDKDGKTAYYVDTFAENIYKDYIRIIVDIEEKIIKYTNNSNPYSLVKEVMEGILEYNLALLVKYNVTKEDLDNFKQYLSELDTKFFTRFSLEKK
jgi:hypothetical protein